MYLFVQQIWLKTLFLTQFWQKFFVISHVELSLRICTDLWAFFLWESVKIVPLLRKDNRSVQIHTETFLKTSIERRVYLEEQFLINKYLNFKLYLRLVKFRQILEYLSGSVQIRRECSSWVVLFQKWFRSSSKARQSCVVSASFLNSSRFLNTHFVVKYQRNWRGDPLEKKNFRKKSHNAEKLKGGTLWGFSTSILSQNIKKLKGENFLFSEKNLTMPKNWKGAPLGFFNIHPVAKLQKIEGGPFGEKIPKKIS